MAKNKHKKYYSENKSNNGVTIIVIIATIVIGAVLLLGGGSPSPTNATTNLENPITNVGDKQIVTVNVSGGYSPETITAKAGVPTILRMKSINASGCERAFRLPSLKISKTLPSNGDTDIDIGSQVAGTKLKGTCSMGMYYVAINFN